MMGLFANRGDSGFSWYSTAEEVTRGIDGTGLTAVITGASSGIGIETTRVLALRGVHVIMAVRNVSSGNEVKEMILKELPSAKIDILEVDLSSFASIRKFASEFNARDLPLNILINNAGIMGTPFLLSSDGFELQFATNHLGHFLLTELLLENMAQSSSRSSREGRIVIISSQAHMVAYKEGIRFDKINDQSAYNAINAYGQSKLANILHANELSRLLKEKRVQVMVNSLHPGSIYTNIFRNIRILDSACRRFAYFGSCRHDIGIGISNLDVLCRTFGRMMFKNVEQGAATTCYLALHPQVKGITGKYFSDSNIASPSAKSTDMELAKKLWDFSSEMTGLHSG